MSWQEISSAEALLLVFLCGIAENVDCPMKWSTLKVRSLDDGAMGSFQIVVSQNEEARGKGRVAEVNNQAVTNVNRGSVAKFKFPGK